jgi:UDP-glucose:(heptosyl)LPS alpha-1,3-glucosyltransferase
VSVISNGVDGMTFHPASVAARRAARARFGLDEARRCALFVGGDWARKGLRFAIGSMSHADNWELVVAGRGDEALYESIARSAGVGERVHFLGLVTDTAELYRAADVFILPTAYETFSLVAYEAAASGLPLLATRVSGIEDVLHHEVSGFVIGFDERDIGLRLRQFDAEPGLAVRMGAEARRITEAFTWESMIVRHQALYRAVRPEADASRPDAV